MLSNGRTFFDHTGDIGVRLSAPTLAGLFREAALAFTETLTDAPVETRRVEPATLEAATGEDLMIAWLDELLYRFEVHNLLPAGANLTVLEGSDGWTLAGHVESDQFDPVRHPIKVLVKGITYHQLHVRRGPDGWETALVFDI